MPNNQAYDPRVTLAADRVAAPVSLVADYVAAPAVPTFGTSALMVEAIDGNLAHKSRVTISTDGAYSFGSKVTPYPRQFVYGSDVRVAGAAVSTPETVGAITGLDAWGAYLGTPAIINTELPDSVIDQMYKGTGVGALTDAAGFSSVTAAQGNKFYCGHFVKDGCDIFRTTVVAYSSITGTFSTNAELTRGETITITKTDASTLTGWIVGVDDVNGYLTIDAFLGASGVGGLSGATVSGDTSGASAALPATVALGTNAASIAATKVMRVYEDHSPTTGASQTTLVTSRTNGGIIDVDMFESGALLNTPPYDSASTDNSNIGSPSDTPNSYMFYELEADFSGATGRVTIRQNGTIVHNRSDYAADKFSPTDGFKLVNIGQDLPGIGSVPIDAVKAGCVFGKIYADSDVRRLYLCNASTLSASTETTPLFCSAWADASITAELYGDATGKYLVVAGPEFTTVGSVQLS